MYEFDTTPTEYVLPKLSKKQKLRNKLRQAEARARIYRRQAESLRNEQ